MKYDGILSLLFTCIEIILLINVFIFAKHKLKFFSIIILFLLAAYQFFEFLICNLNFQHKIFVYLAFVVITFLPPFGLLLSLRLNDIKSNKYNLIFIPALFFTIFYLLNLEKFAVVKCTVFYASYNYPLGFLYGLFYYLPIVLALFVHSSKLKSKNEAAKKANKMLMVGYFSFLIPTIIAIIFYPTARNAIESIMCKFAFLFAIIISYFTLSFKGKDI